MILAAIVLAAAAPAPAQPQADPKTTIARLDANKDGVASLQEWVAVGNHEAGFKLMDTNHDGKVTVVELTAFRGARARGDVPPPAPRPRPAPEPDTSGFAS
jgi:hypothetical protein